MQGLASVSDKLLFATIVVYALAMLCFAGEQAARKARTGTRELVGAGGRYEELYRTQFDDSEAVPVEVRAQVPAQVVGD